MSMFTQRASVSSATSLVVPQAAVHSPVIGKPYVYVLPTVDRSRMKIGRSIDPLGRIAGLLRHHPEVALDRAVIISVDSLSVEKIIHTVFDSLRSPLSKRTDGYTEWFEGDFVDQVISLCGTVAEYRSSEITVTRNLSEEMRIYLQQNPAHLLHPPRLSKAERAARSQVLIERMSELAVDCAEYFIEVMAERCLAHTQDRAGRHYLLREFNVIEEPVCCADNGMELPSRWGSRLCAAGDVTVSVDGSQAIFHLVKPPIYRQLDHSCRREYFQITQGPDEVALLGVPDVSAEAFAALWAVVQKIPEITCEEIES